ncbi:MAG: chorismate mutase [Legionella sp.]
MSTIEQLRLDIKEIDLAIIRSLAQRAKLSKQLSTLKIKANKPIIDRRQEKNNFDYYQILSKEYCLDPEFVASVFQLIIINSRMIQEQYNKRPDY